MPPDTTAVIVGSAHCGGKWDGCANISPMNVAIALIVACRAALSIVRSICASRATATAALTVPQTDARNACSKLNAAKTFPRAHYEKAGEPRSSEFFSSRPNKPTGAQITECVEDAELEAPHRQFLPRPFFHHFPLTCAIRLRKRVMNSHHMVSILVERWNQGGKCLPVGRRAVEESDHRHWLLPTRRERPHCRYAEQRDELAPLRR